MIGTATPQVAKAVAALAIAIGTTTGADHRAIGPPLVKANGLR
jgi:hypothetical protein